MSKSYTTANAAESTARCLCQKTKKVGRHAEEASKEESKKQGTDHSWPRMLMNGHFGRKWKSPVGFVTSRESA